MYKTLKDIVNKIDKTLKAKEYSDELYGELLANSFDVKREIRVPARGDGRSGRIDMVAVRDGLSLALEIDWCTPRKKSVYKLKNYSSDYRAVVLRESGEIVLVNET